MKTNKDTGIQNSQWDHSHPAIHNTATPVITTDSTLNKMSCSSSLSSTPLVASFPFPPWLPFPFEVPSLPEAVFLGWFPVLMTVVKVTGAPCSPPPPPPSPPPPAAVGVGVGHGDPLGLTELAALSPLQVFVMSARSGIPAWLHPQSWTQPVYTAWKNVLQ